ncbi:tyrosine-type recombinase/integrase [Amycolatopsis sp. cmx-4-61]|uniref:tyrosine-type recombinase/integrase n=1 Tax=Amycolatopsis sp. cmx-4-61 TaxID=2790937 RepID=UPI00397A206A
MSSELVAVPGTVIEVSADAEVAAYQLLREIAEAVELYPALPPPDPSDRYHLRNLTALWLVGLSETSRSSYYETLGDWLSWCDRHGLGWRPGGPASPLTARRADTDAWKAQMTAQKRGKGNVMTRVPAAKSTVYKRLAIVSSWYKYLQSNEIVTGNPAGATTRPTPPKRSTLPALAADETSMFLDWLIARAERLNSEAAWRDCAHLHLMFRTGLRVSPACTAEFAHIGFESGICVLRYVKKSRGEGIEWDWVPLEAGLLEVLHRYWAFVAERLSREQGRTVTVDDLTGPLFVSTPHPHQPERTGGRPMNQKHVQRTLRELARQAGLKSWKTITPHSTRRTAGTLALANGATLAQVQDLLGHADPRTTRRYDDARHRLETSPVFTIAATLAAEHRKQHAAQPAAPEPVAAAAGTVAS